MIRILLCEDDARFRRLLTKVLASVEDFRLVGEAGTGEEACRLVRSANPDLLLLDLELPGISGMEVIHRLRGPGCNAPEILILTSFSDEERVFEAMRLGAAGYLVKGVAPSALEVAIREIMAGGTVIESRLARRFWRYFASVKGKTEQTYGLTGDELEVLALVARGLSNPETARVLGASRRSIKAHLERIYQKLGVSGRVEATVMALQAGLIDV